VAIQTAHVTPVTEIRPELPVELDRWFDKALARTPSDRFESAETMAKMFRVAVSRPSNFTRPFRRPVAVSAVATLDAALGGVSHTTRRVRRGLPWSTQMSAYIAGGSAVGLCVGVMLFASPQSSDIPSSLPRPPAGTATNHVSVTSATLPAPVPAPELAKAEPLVSPVRAEALPSAAPASRASVALVKVASTTLASPTLASATLASIAPSKSLAVTTEPARVANALAPPSTGTPASASAATASEANASAANASAANTASGAAAPTSPASDAGAPAVANVPAAASDVHDWKPTDELGEP
jgi:hypothetical protein